MQVVLVQVVLVFLFFVVVGQGVFWGVMLMGGGRVELAK